MMETQISVVVQESTRDLLERRARARGLKKSHIVEQALLHYLLALDEMPEEFLVPQRVTLTADGFKKVVEQIESGEPTPALRKLMRGD